MAGCWRLLESTVRLQRALTACQRGVALFEVLRCALALTPESVVACTVHPLMSKGCSAWCSNSAGRMHNCLSSGVTASPLKLPGVLWAWLNQSVCCACAWKSHESGMFFYSFGLATMELHLCDHISLCAAAASWADRFQWPPCVGGL